MPYQECFQGEEVEYDIHTVTKSRSSGYMVSVKLNGHTVGMLMDTGAVVLIVPE